MLMTFQFYLIKIRETKLIVIITLSVYIEPCNLIIANVRHTNKHTN